MSKKRSETEEIWLAKFSARLYAAREVLGLSQGELADEVKAHPNSVQQWEAGNTMPRGFHYARLRAVLKRAETKRKAKVAKR